MNGKNNKDIIDIVDYKINDANDFELLNADANTRHSKREDDIFRMNYEDYLNKRRGRLSKRASIAVLIATLLIASTLSYAWFTYQKYQNPSKFENGLSVEWNIWPFNDTQSKNEGAKDNIVEASEDIAEAGEQSKEAVPGIASEENGTESVTSKESVNTDNSEAGTVLSLSAGMDAIISNIDKELETLKQDIDSAPYLGFNFDSDEMGTKVGDLKLYHGYNVQETENTETVEDAAIISDHIILIDGFSGDAVCQRNGFERVVPASMTKILTVLVAAEHIKPENLNDEVVIEASDNNYAYKSGLSVAGFDVGEKVKVRDLFYGTILPSGADAAIALAKYVAGDEEHFVELMNQKVEDLGLTESHFTNCVGSYNEEHYTTCAEMAMILKAAVENEFCYKVLNTHIYTTSKTTEHPGGLEISNWFLRRIEDKDTYGEVMCAKTGFVRQSKSCAASYQVDKNGHPYICVTTGSYSSWRCIYDQVDIYYNYCSGAQ